MKKIILFPFILFFSVANGQCLRINDSTVECSFSFLGLKTREEASSYRALKIARDTPVYIVDGVITNEAEIKKLDPDNIESISSLKKGITKIILYHQSLNDVIVIVTKTADQRIITVKDMHNGEILPGASVEIISTERTRNTIHLIADSLGRVVTNKIVPGKEYELRVSNVGYKTFRLNVNSRQISKHYTLLLEREYEKLDEITIRSIKRMPGPRKNNSCFAPVGEFRCLAPGVRVTGYDQINIQEEKNISNIKLYPNPVMRAQKIDIEFEGKQGKVTVRLFSLDYKLINAKEYDSSNGINRISFFINLQLSSGMYIIQLFDEKNYPVKTEKLMIQ